MKKFFKLIFLYFLSVIRCDENSFPKTFYSTFSKKNYMVVASQILRPRITFSIAVHVFDDPAFSYKFFNRSFQFQAIITSNSNEIVSHRQTLYWNYPQLVYFPIPVLSDSTYELQVIAVGSNEITIFDETSKLIYDENFVIVTFQISRPIYRSGQTVRFRIYVLEMSLRPFNDVMDVFIVDPDNFIMKRWLSTYTNNGVASLHFKLPKLAKNGVWKIRSKISNQINEKHIIVQTYYQPMFEVIVDCSPYTTVDEDKILAIVYGLFPSQKFVRGNATISWFSRKYLNTSEFILIQTDSIFIKEQKIEALLPLQKLDGFYQNVSDVEVKIVATLTEFMSGETVSGFSHSRILMASSRIKFLSKSPMVFTPGTIFNGYVAVSYGDHERIPLEMLRNSEIKVEITVDTPFPDGKLTSVISINGSCGPNTNLDNSKNFYNMLREKSLQQRFLETSVISYSFVIPKTTSHVELKAIFNFAGKSIADKVYVVKKYLPENKYIKVWTTSEDLSVGDNAVFHLTMNFEVDFFYSLILSKGVVLLVKEHEIPTSALSTVTISVPTSSEMSPLFHLIVYCFSKETGIVSDAVSLPLQGFTRYKTTLEINTGKDFRNEAVEVLASGAEGAFIGVQAVRSIVYHLQADHEITVTKMTENFLTTFEKNYRSISQTTWISRTGEIAETNYYVPSHNYVFDTHHLFNLNNLLLITNLNLPLSYRYQECHNSYLPCLTEGCYSSVTQCDNFMDCVDGTDESNCPLKNENRKEYYLYRINWHSFIFDEQEGDWAFFEFRKNDHEGVEFQFLDTPMSADDWFFSAVNMDMKYGFSMLAAPVIFSSRKPLMAHVHGPNQCHRGEQLGLKVYVHNFDINQMMVTITLINSEDYKFVHVGHDGIVASYTARLTTGDHQILIYMPAESQKEIHFPVAPSIEQGIVEIKFEVSSQAGRKSLTHRVEILAEGALINRHTSISVDLKNRGFILQYLDIIIEETPIVPYEIWRRYVFGSPAANITISNDVIGPVVPSQFLTVNTVLKRESKGAMDILFELQINIWTLHYLRFTNQLNWNILRETLNNCNSLYAEVMRYFHKEGWFEFWETSVFDRPSVWLTAWALRILNDINFPDWEFHIWIDPSVLMKIIEWLVNHQHKNGLFFETVFYSEHYFDGRIQSNQGEAEIILTAHVLISLHFAANVVDGELKSKAIISCHKARIALEEVFRLVDDPYSLSIIAYALSITSSSKAGVAFDVLKKHARMNDEGFYYWSRLPIPVNPVKLENQRRYIRPKLYENSISTAVEATSWALLVYLARDGVSPFVENIVQWLMSVRMTNCGFISVIDTAVAYRGLTEFVLRSKILDMTNMDLTMEMMASTMTKYHVHLSNKSTSVQNFKIPYVWGHIDIAAKGSGLAFIQLDVNYGIDDEHLVDKPSTNYFQLKITEFYSSYRNKSIITIQSCLKFVPATFSKSGAVILEIQVPTGYTLRESDAIEILKTNIHPTLRDVRIVQGKTIWFFDYLTNDLKCFNHSIKRWYPVANLTLHRQAVMYEITAREHFVQVLINSTQLYTLSICEVCGSYECPYCPYFNAAAYSLSVNVVYFVIVFLMFQLIKFKTI